MTNNTTKQKTVLVTVANNPEGIGAAITKSFHNSGFKVILHGYADPKDSAKVIPKELGTQRYTALNKQLPEVTAKQIGTDILSFNCDLRDESNIKALFAYAIKHCGHVDVLINNAAISVADSFLSKVDSADNSIISLSSETIDANFSINTKAAMLLVKEYVNQYMTYNLTTGSIINISTDSAYGGFPEEVSYQASKLALESYTRSSAVEIGPIGIRVNAIEPGPVQSGWINGELEKLCLASIPMQKIGTPKDIANGALFLVSEQSSWITGQVLKINGGHRM